MKEATSNVSSPCVVCGEPTELACVDCVMDFDKVIHVCHRTACRNDHEVVEATLRQLKKSLNRGTGPTEGGATG